jgi:hypothetical protein
MNAPAPLLFVAQCASRAVGAATIASTRTEQRSVDLPRKRWPTSIERLQVVRSMRNSTQWFGVRRVDTATLRKGKTMSKPTRSALAALAATGVIAATGVVGVASAAAAASTRSPERNDPRLPVVDGRTVSHVEAVNPTHGPGSGLFYHNVFCNNAADRINEQIESGLKDLYAGNMEGAETKFGEAVETLRDAESDGCTFV